MQKNSENTSHVYTNNIHIINPDFVMWELALL